MAGLFNQDTSRLKGRCGGRPRLVELWIECMDKIGEDARQLLPLKPIYFLAPRD